MNLAHELTQFNPHTASPETLTALLESWIEQAKNDATENARQRAEIQHKETKIAALTYELAWHKRIKFGAKTEAMSAQQRDLFHESQAEDLAAIEAQTEQLTPAAPTTVRRLIT